MPRNLPLSGLWPAVVVATGLVVLPLEIVTEAQQAWGHPDLDGVWTSDDMRGSQVEGRQPVRELGGAR
jgi:hypothetical protein